MIAFGENILLWRLHRSLTQEQLANKAGIPRPNLSDIEKGKRDVTLSTIRSLAKALDVSPGTLVNGEPPKCNSLQKPLTRECMERVARSVALGIPPKDPSEHQLNGLLKDVLRCSLTSARTRKQKLPFPTRRGSRAWLLLNALYPEETVKSLITRSLEHAERK